MQGLNELEGRLIATGNLERQKSAKLAILSVSSCTTRLATARDASSCTVTRTAIDPAKVTKG